MIDDNVTTASSLCDVMYKSSPPRGGQRYSPTAPDLHSIDTPLYITLLKAGPHTPADTQYLAYFWIIRSHLIATTSRAYILHTLTRPLASPIISHLPLAMSSATSSSDARPTLPPLHTLGLLPDALSIDNISLSDSPAGSSDWVCDATDLLSHKMLMIMLAK